MVTAIQIQKYAWVVELLMSKKKLTLQQINDEWSRSTLSNNFSGPHNRKTWYKCFDDIGLVYGIIISVTPKNAGNKWYIVNPDALRGREVLKWMLACVAHRNLLEECLGMNNRMDIEGFPSENGMLHPIATAMKENRKIEVLYRRYGNAKPKRHIVEPYFIKTYNHRFYVLCKFDTGLYFTLSFDRMLQIDVLKEHFNFPDNLFAQEFFEDAFGVMIPNMEQKAIDIVVKAKGDARYYLEDLPLHHSQHVVREYDDMAEFMVHIWPTEDFFGEVLRHGERLEIMSPVEARNHIRERLQRTLLQYDSV